MDFSHDTWTAAAGAFGGYAAILLGMFVLLFLLPYAVFVVFNVS